jgi:hypothetical protein
MEKKLAPIVLFVYNRPKHTLRTLQALQKNKEASESDLYIFCDGAKSNASKLNLQQIQEVRKVVNSQKWCKNVHIIESQHNNGLAKSISEGVTKIVNQYGKVIVLEDDIESSPSFLKFMNQALDFYENQEKVMHISGYMFPVKEALPDTFFFRATSCWGWATWQQAWQNFNPDALDLLNQIENKGLSYQFDIDGTSGYLNQLKDNVQGKITTWAVKWYASVFLNDGLCLHPRKSLVQNIGQDNTGVHSGTTDYYFIPALAENINITPIKIEESKKGYQSIRDFYSNYPKNSILKRIVNKISLLLNLQ